MIRTRIGRLVSVVMALAVAGLAACSGTPELPTADLIEKAKAQQSEYHIGPLDSLQIFVWRNPDLSTSVTVRPDGRISVPLIEDLEVTGKTPT